MFDNVLFFLQFKKDLQYLYPSLSLKEALLLMKTHGFTAVPVVDKDGRYCGSVNDADFLWYLYEHGNSEDVLEHATVADLIRPDFMPAVSISISIEELIERALHQNYVPVVDDRRCFIGIVTRQSLLRQLGLATRWTCPVQPKTLPISELAV